MELPVTTQECVATDMSIFGVDVDLTQICLIKGTPSKHDALDQLIDALCQNPVVTDCDAFRKAVYAREAIMSTGIGDGIAIPHVRIPEIQTPTLGVGVAPEGIEFGTLDNQPVYVMVLFATPAEADREYLGLLAKVMLALRNRSLFDKMVACQTREEILQTLQNGG